jgi:hypothetical protein
LQYIIRRIAQQTFHGNSCWINLAGDLTGRNILTGNTWDRKHTLLNIMPMKYSSKQYSLHHRRTLMRKTGKEKLKSLHRWNSTKDNSQMMKINSLTPDKGTQNDGPHENLGVKLESLGNSHQTLLTTD